MIERQKIDRDIIEHPVHIFQNSRSDEGTYRLDEDGLNFEKDRGF